MQNLSDGLRVVRGDTPPQDGSDPPPLTWVVVVPVKVLAVAKSRLAPLGDRTRRQAALAMACDTVAAAAACPGVREVVVVTSDATAAAALAAPSVLVVADTPDAGLDAALVHGAAVAARRHPDSGVAALSADLPALRPKELGRALAAAPLTGRAVVADAAGAGTVLLCAGPGVALRPAYGAASRARHTAGGAQDLTGLLGGGVPGLRRDVDTPADLEEALALGPGPALTALAGARPVGS